MMPVILIGGIVGGVGTPTEVSTFAVLYGLVLGVLYRRIDLRNIWSVLTSASLLNGMIFFTVSAATIFSWALTLEGITVAIANLVASLGAHGLPADGDRHHGDHGRAARELRHHRDPCAAAAAGRASSSASIRCSTESS